MGALIRESDDGKPSKTEPKSQPSKNAPAKDARKDDDAVPSSRATEAPDPPWKRKLRREVFEGDVALVELRSRLAQRSERIPEPVLQFSTPPRFSGALRLMSGVAVAAAVAGVTGYFWGFKLSIKMSEPTPASDRADVLPALSSPTATLTASDRDFQQASSRTASNGLAGADMRFTAHAATSAQQPALLPTWQQTVSPPAVSRPPVVAKDASVIAAKMKIGVELMTYGEVSAARMMFQRAAEAGEGAGAFALAETYDPLVLRGLRLREAITPDLALARTWYERARDLGSLEAQERISRLAQLPQ
jgi:hypothetical protein